MKKVLYTLLIVFLLIIVTGCNNKDTDESKFKEEYESLNNEYLEIDIIKDNNIKYSTVNEVVDILLNGTGIIYLGNPLDAMSRNVIPVLLESASELGVEEIYYLKLKNEDSENQIESLTPSMEDYKTLFDVLKDSLDSYKLEDNSISPINEEDNTIVIPTVIFVHEGEIVGTHTNSVKTHVDPNQLLTNDEKNELMDIYINYIHKVLNDVCTEAC